MNPTVSVAGYIGTFNNPITVNISGILTVHAGGMLDSTSIALQGTSGGYSWRESIPGFVFTNRNLESHVGQSNIRATIEQGESVLYSSFTPQSILPPKHALIAVPSMNGIKKLNLPQPMLTLENGNLFVRYP